MSSFGDKKKQHANCARETPIGVDKMFSGKKENQSISVINDFFPDHF